MKKLLKVLGIASIFAAVLGFGFVACDNGGGSGSGDGNGGGGGGGGGGGSTVTATNVTLDFSKTGPFYNELKSYLENDETNSKKPGKDTTLTASDGVTVLLNGSGKNVAYKYNQDSGFVIKKGDNGTAAPMTIKGVKGNVKVTVIWAIAGKKTAGDRKLTLSAGGQSKEDGNVNTESKANPIDVDHETSISYDFGNGGTDINITADNEICIKTITIADPNAFVSKTDDSIANDVATLGIEGTGVSSSNEEVATAEISGGKIVITSKKAGSATITVTATGSTSKAEIPVSVNAKGEITLGTIVKISFEEKTYELSDVPTTGLNPRFGAIVGVAIKSGAADDVVTIDATAKTCTTKKEGTTTFVIMNEAEDRVESVVTVDDKGNLSFGKYTKCFIADTKNIANDNDTLGVVATEGNVSVTEGEDFVEVELDATDGIKITSKAAGTAKISAGDGTNTAKITATVDEEGTITTSVAKHLPSGLTMTWRAGDEVATNDLFTVDVSKLANTATYDAPAQDESGLTFSKMVYGNGGANATGNNATVTAKVDVTLTVYFTIGDGNLSTAGKTKAGDLKWKIGDTETAGTDTGDKTSNKAYAKEITLSAGETVIIYTTANRLGLFGIVGKN